MAPFLRQYIKFVFLTATQVDPYEKQVCIGYAEPWALDILAALGIVPLKYIEYGFGVYYNKTPIYPIFHLLKGDYAPQGIQAYKAKGLKVWLWRRFTSCNNPLRIITRVIIITGAQYQPCLYTYLGKWLACKHRLGGLPRVKLRCTNRLRLCSSNG